jgi:Tfp pilus assembly protein PilO
MLTKLKIIVGLLIIIVIGESVYFSSKSDKEEQKTQVFEQKTQASLREDFSKGLDNVSVLVKIKEQTSEGEYNDSLYYSLEQWMTKSADDIKTDKQKRVDNWINTVRKPAQE